MMEETDRKTEEAVNELRSNARAQEEQEALFQKKVLLIGDLHTERALLANRIGALKSETIIRRDEAEPENKTRIAEIEKRMREISHDITEFSPENIDALMAFKAGIDRRFESIESALEALRTTDGPDDAPSA